MFVPEVVGSLNSHSNRSVDSEDADSDDDNACEGGKLRGSDGKNGNESKSRQQRDVERYLEQNPCILQSMQARLQRHMWLVYVLVIGLISVCTLSTRSLLLQIETNQFWFSFMEGIAVFDIVVYIW